MSPNMRLSFQFHPVGQGLFYSGQFNEFRFVYDCGTDSGQVYMDRALNGYEVDGKLDLLILSHFHDDHINGVKKLLAKTKGVREVILPYLYPAERLITAASYAVRNNLDTLPGQYIDFLRDPVAFLTQEGAERITFIASGEPVGEWPDYPGGMADGIAWYGETLDKATFPELNTAPDQVRIKPHSVICRATIWRFKFFCPPGRASTSDIRKEMQARGIDPDNVAGTLHDRLDDLKDIYHSLFGGSQGQNVTSLVCCHGPVVRIHYHHGWLAPWSLLQTCYRPLWFPWRAGILEWLHLQDNDNPAIDQMLTGDANLTVTEYRHHFSRELRRVGLFCLPHHGSRENWRTAFLSDHTNCTLWVCAAGLGNRHRHPHMKVVQDLCTADAQMCLCHEFQGLAIEAMGSAL